MLKKKKKNVIQKIPLSVWQYFCCKNENFGWHLQLDFEWKFSGSLRIRRHFGGGLRRIWHLEGHSSLSLQIRAKNSLSLLLWSKFSQQKCWFYEYYIKFCRKHQNLQWYLFEIQEEKKCIFQGEIIKVKFWKNDVLQEILPYRKWYFLNDEIFVIFW